VGDSYTALGSQEYAHWLKFYVVLGKVEGDMAGE